MKRHLLPLLMLCGMGLAQAEPAQVIRATELKAQPYSDATTLLPLAEKSTVEVLSREGGWYKVTVAGKEGWLRMTTLRLGSSGARAGDSGVGSALKFLTTGRSGSSGVTVATGVRGLEAADITNATPDPKAVAQLDTLAVPAEEARRHAAAQGLQAQGIAYLPAPQTTAAR